MFKEHCNNDLPFPEYDEKEDVASLKRYISKLEHDLFFLYVFLTANEDCETACEYLAEHAEDHSPIGYAHAFEQL